MRTTKRTGLILMLVVAAGFVFAEAQKADKSETKVNEKTQPMVREIPGRQMSSDQMGHGRAVPDREQMYRERIAKQTETYKASLKELEDIKKIAEEEGATKTVEAIQKLIEQKDAAFKEKQQEAVRAQKERAAKVKERVKQSEADKTPKSDNDKKNKKTSDQTPKQ